MKISVISRWRDEEFFAPFFLNHYSLFADEIIIMLDDHTTDNSAEIIKRYDKARFDYFNTIGKIDNTLYAEMMSKLAWSLTSDWVFYVDADEFIFPFGDLSFTKKNVEDTLNKVSSKENLLVTHLYLVYRHVEDADLDPSKPTLCQRRHGEPKLKLKKSCIVRPSAKIKWRPGQHEVNPAPNVKISPVKFNGVHWKLADVEHACSHSVLRALPENRSVGDLKHGFGKRNWTADLIKKRCAAHSNDPLVI